MAAVVEWKLAGVEYPNAARALVQFAARTAGSGPWLYRDASQGSVMPELMGTAPENSSVMAGARME